MRGMSQEMISSYLDEHAERMLWSDKKHGISEHSATHRWPISGRLNMVCHTGLQTALFRANHFHKESISLKDTLFCYIIFHILKVISAGLRCKTNLHVLLSISMCRLPARAGVLHMSAVKYGCAEYVRNLETLLTITATHKSSIKNLLPMRSHDYS